MVAVLLPLLSSPPDDAGEQLAMATNKSAARAGENPLTIGDGTNNLCPSSIEVYI